MEYTTKQCITYVSDSNAPFLSNVCSEKEWNLVSNGFNHTIYLNGTSRYLVDMFESANNV